jgi:hypothetical protein
MTFLTDYYEYFFIGVEHQGKKIFILAMMDCHFIKDQENLVDIFVFIMTVHIIFYDISNSFEYSQSTMVSQSVIFPSNSKNFKIFTIFLITIIIRIIWSIYKSISYLEI